MAAAKQQDFLFEFSDEDVDGPDRILIFGEPGIGKTTFGAKCPKPVIIDLEGSSRKIKKKNGVPPVNRLKGLVFDPNDPAGNWEKLLKAVAFVATAEHDRETVVIDTLDKAESWAIEYVKQRIGKPKEKGSSVVIPVKSLNQVGDGYGAGQLAVAEQMRALVALLDQCNARGMRVVVLAHAKIESVNTPDGTDSSRWSMKVDRRVAGIFLEGMDYVCHAYAPPALSKKDDKKNSKVVTRGGNKRFLYVGLSAIRGTKCRVPMASERIDFSFEAFAKAVALGGDPALYRDMVRGIIETQVLDQKVRAKMLASLERFEDDITEMDALKGRIEEYLGTVAVPAPTEDDAAPEGDGDENEEPEQEGTAAE